MDWESAIKTQNRNLFYFWKCPVFLILTLREEWFLSIFLFWSRKLRNIIATANILRGYFSYIKFGVFAPDYLADWIFVIYRIYKIQTRNKDRYGGCIVLVACTVLTNSSRRNISIRCLRAPSPISEPLWKGEK